MLQPLEKPYSESIRYHANSQTETGNIEAATREEIAACITTSVRDAPLCSNLDEFLTLPPVEDDNLCALPTTASVRLNEPDYPEYHRLPVLVKTDLSSHKELHDPEKHAPWAPKDGASTLTTAHVNYATKFFQTSHPTDVSPREERSWRYAQMTGRLSEACAKRRREGQKRIAASTKRSEDESSRRESSPDSSETLSPTPKPRKSSSVTPSSSDSEDPTSTLEPLRSILRENIPEYFKPGYKGFKPEWVIRNGPPDEQTRAVQEKVFNLAKGFWEYVEGRPMETTGQLEPLWVQTPAERRATEVQGVLRDYTAPNGQGTRRQAWERLKAEYATGSGREDHVLQPGEEFDILKVDHDPLDDIFDEPDHPIGIFDPAEVAYDMERQRQEKIKELRSHGATEEQIEDFHQQAFGASQQELDQVGEHARKTLVESGKLLPKSPPKKRKRGPE